ncbi:MAG: DUF1385 domain-containing protein [Ruminococcaceae bacterium]|nr:DUF1385 domain-containing protein [Oscillospiraceae bacterium]
MKKQKECEVLRKTSVGGEALIEGIMMRGPKGSAVACRLPDGTVETEFIEYKPISAKTKFFKVPIIRGFVNFIDSMLLGYKAMMLSAEKQGIDDDINEEELSKFDKWLVKHFGDKVMSIVSTVGMVLGLLLAFVLFFWMPTFLFQAISVGAAKGFGWMFQNFGLLFSKGEVIKTILAASALAPFKALFEGVLRMIIFILYILLISRMKDIQRVFQYHGAEHKTIFCYEKGLPLTVENVKKQIRFHPRCGTSFIFMILIVSIIFSTILSYVMPDFIVQTRMLWIAIKILLLPFMMGIGYELIKYAGKHDNVFVKIVSAPGLWMQRLTTKEPSEDAIIEIGIASLQAVITDNPEDDSI